MLDKWSLDKLLEQLWMVFQTLKLLTIITVDTLRH